MKLSPSKAMHFFDTLRPLLNWVKRTEEGTAAIEDARNEDNNNFREDAVLLHMIWDQPEYIDEYLEEMGETLTPSVRRDLAKWREQYVYESFIIERHTSSGSIFISTSDGQVYLVCGISEEIEDVLRSLELPCIVETALLPYAGKIVYDSVISALPDVLSASAKQALIKVYDAAKRNNCIAKKLPVINQVESSEEWSDLLEILMSTMRDKTGDISPEEVSQKLNNDPRLNLISKEELATLETLNNKPHRTQEDWDVITDILTERSVFTITPRVTTEKTKAIGQVLLHDGYLHVFTTFEKCQGYTDLVTKEDPRQNYFNINTLDFQEAMDTADKYGIDLCVDHPSDLSYVQKYIEYDSETGNLRSMMVVPPSHKAEVLKNKK